MCQCLVDSYLGGRVETCRFMYNVPETIGYL